MAASAHIVRGVEGACFPRDGFGAPTRLDRGTGRLHRRVRTNLTARTMAAARAATVDGDCRSRTVPEPSARTKRPFVAKLRRSRRRFRPISRRNRIIRGSEQSEAVERTSHGRSGQQSIRLAPCDGIDPVVLLRSTTVGDEKGRLRRPPAAAGVAAPEERIQSEARVRVCTRARARTRACCVSPCGANQKHVAARVFRRHVPTDTPRRTRSIFGRPIALRHIRTARLSHAGQPRRATRSTLSTRWPSDAPLARNTRRCRSDFLQSRSRHPRASKQPDGCAWRCWTVRRVHRS